MAIRKNHSLRRCRNRQPGFHKSKEVMEHFQNAGNMKERCSQCLYCSGWPYFVMGGSPGGEK